MTTKQRGLFVNLLRACNLYFWCLLVAVHVNEDRRSVWLRFFCVLLLIIIYIGIYVH
jgi:threonine/homoserine/homoserine lactone efflux protein